MNWGKWIVVSFLIFAGFIGALVTVCIRSDVSLVSKDYYREELEFQKQITRLENTSTLKSKPSIEVGIGTIQIAFDFNALDTGSLILFRPSDAAMDKKFLLTQSTSAIQVFSTVNMNRGMYRARMQWMQDGKEYFHEQVIFI